MRRAATTTSACTLVLGACLGTPLLYYVFQMPSYSHVCAQLCVALIVYLTLRWRKEWTTRRAIAIAAMPLGEGVGESSMGVIS